MKDAEFIELLNLYLDHEISPVDAARLEVEVQRSPERRKVYRDYCRMQKACMVLAEEAVTAPAVIENNVVSFERPSSRAWGFTTYATGLCAAAACVALALVVRTGHGSAGGAPQASDPATVAAVQISPLASERSGARDFPLTVSVNARATEQLQPVFAAQSLALTKQARNESATAASIDPRFEWMQRVQVASLKGVDADELLFDAKPTLQPDSRSFRSRRMIEGQFEKAAFQFQR